MDNGAATASVPIVTLVPPNCVCQTQPLDAVMGMRFPPPHGINGTLDMWNHPDIGHAQDPNGAAAGQASPPVSDGSSAGSWSPPWLQGANMEPPRFAGGMPGPFPPRPHSVCGTDGKNYTTMCDFVNAQVTNPSESVDLS